MTIANEWQVLVVEDEYDSIQMVSKILQHYGAKVHVAHDGRECITMLQSMIPTIIIMDLALPEMDGWEMFREMRQQSDVQDIPVIALTAHAMVGDREKALKAGCDDYIPKPIDLRELTSKLTTYLG